jgi:glc operon protein GlcG
MSLRGRMPVLIDGEVAGAVGIAGRSKESDTEIAKETAATVSSTAKAGSSR